MTNLFPLSAIIITVLLNCSSANPQDDLTSNFVTKPIEFNQIPEVNDLALSFDSDSTKLAITYTVTDEENDLLSIKIYQVFLDGNERSISESFLTGEVENVRSSNSEKSIVWNIESDSSFKATDRFRIKIEADDGFANDLSQLISLVDSSRIKNDIQNFQGVRHYSGNPSHLENSREYIRAQFKDHQIVQFDQKFPNRSTQGINIIGSITGDEGEHEYYIIDGHYDTVSSTPGADDNASGTAGMLEAMRILSQFNFKKGIRFIGFDMEELGLVGSRFYARNITKDENILGMINFEMIAYTCKGEPECKDFVNADSSIYNIRSSFASTMSDNFLEIGNTYVPELKITAVMDDGDPNFRRSDHAPFWDIGVDALFLADGANFRNPHYHKSSDELKTLDIAFATNIVKTTVGTIAKLAGFNHKGSAISTTIVIK